MTDDLLSALKAADPAARVDLSRIDDGAFAPLREGIPMTTRPMTDPPKLRGRMVLAGVCAAVLLGGAAAGAAYDRWYAGGGADGLTCITMWTDPLTAKDIDSTGGPALTSDPIADCQRYQQESGEQAIVDPVAFTRNGQTFVAPRGQVPDDGRLLPGAPPQAAAALELEASLRDWVDGGESGCFDRESGPAFVRGELARLGLTAWTVRVMPDNRPHEEGPCGFFSADAAQSEAAFHPDRQEDRESTRPPGGDSFVLDVRDALRAGITQKCVSVGEAEQVARAAVGGRHHWPTTAVVDESVDCARADLVAGGSIQITVYGPRVAAR